jgi:hypothetical protein
MEVLAGVSQVGLPATLFAYEFLVGGLWSWAVGLLAVLGIIAPWANAAKTTRMLAAPMIIASVIAVAWTGTGPLAEGVLSGAGVVAFILAAQVLGDALVRGGYDRLIRALWSGIRWRSAWLALLGGYILSWVFMFTSMPVMYSALYRYDDAARDARSPVAKDLGILLARAYGAAAVATPMGATVLVALAVTSVSLGDFLVVATPLSLMMAPLALIGIGGKLRALDEPGVRVTTEAAPTGSRFAYILLWAMLAALTVMIGVVSILHLPPLASVSLGVILIAAVWGLLGVRFVSGAPGGFSGWSSELARYGHRLSDGGLLILAGSVVGTSLARTPLMDSLESALTELGITIVGMIVTIVVVVALRVVGMPPPAIVLVAGPVLVRAISLDADAMALLLVVASIFGFLVSPASLTSAMVASMTGWTPVEVSLSRQAPFVILAGVLSCAYVLLIT